MEPKKFKPILKIFKDTKQLKHNKIFTRDAKILVLGEDNFEFSLWVGRVTNSLHNIWATSPAKIGSDEIKTTSIQHHKKLLTEGNAHVFHEIGLPFFSLNPLLFGKPPNNTNLFDRVVCYKTDSSHLFSHCIACSKSILRPGGEVYHFDRRSGAYNSWDLEKIAKEHEMDVEEVWFDYAPWEDYRSGKHEYTILRFFKKPEMETQTPSQDDIEV